MFKSIVQLVLGTLFSKLGPILFGSAVLTKYDSEIYSHFISFLLIANMTVNLGVMGIGPQILSDKNKAMKWVYYIVPLSIVLLSVVVSLIANDSFSYLESVLTIALAIGLSIVYLSSSALNMMGLNSYSALAWSLLGFLNVLSLLFLFFFEVSKGYVFAIYVIPVLFSCFISIILVSKLVSFKCEGISLKRVIYVSKNALCISTFGFAVISSFFFTQNKLTSDDKFLFSLFYQFFTIVTFLPGVIGNIVIPKMTTEKVSCRFELKIYSLYAFVFIIVCMFVFLAFFVDSVLLTNNFEYITKTISANFPSAILLFLSTFLAVVNSFAIQKTIARANFSLMFKAALLWISVFYSLFLIFEVSIYLVSIAFLVSYLCVTAYFLINSKPSSRYAKV
ncbi:hypothetical protein CGI30_08700 [Vibrio parahaemolyticus]|uniref:hypothetical protein n=1 Tax=Vibrio parahaemolyticus TaxID=670 RepID=UPI00111D9107|nr:hypothetical protein [Vibrio parahaemolyticus]TOJ89290.1 hypothetical protein CGI30_08700 [Vibrio parahaemolyticus]